MNCKQNQKINQVKESTLVVGIDIGSTTQSARAFDWRGIELGKVFSLYRKFLKSSEIVYNRLEIKNDMAKERMLDSP